MEGLHIPCSRLIHDPAISIIRLSGTSAAERSVRVRGSQKSTVSREYENVKYFQSYILITSKNQKYWWQMQSETYNARITCDNHAPTPGFMRFIITSQNY